MKRLVSSSACLFGLPTLLFLIFAPGVSAQFQTPIVLDELEPITPENAYNMEQLQIIDNLAFVTTVTFNVDGSLLASGHTDDRIKIWNVETGEEVIVLVGHSNLITDVAFSPDGTILASASRDKTVRVWDIATGTEIAVLRGFPGAALSLVFSPDGARLITGSVEDASLQSCNTTTYILSSTLLTGSIAVESVVVSPDGNTVAITSWPRGSTGGRIIQLVDMTTGSVQTFPHTYSGDITQVVFSPDGNILSSAAADRRVRLWDVGTATELSVLQGHDSFVNSVAFTPDGQILAPASGELGGAGDNSIRLWEIGTNTQLVVFREHTSAITSITFNMDGTLLASASYDGTIRLWGKPASS